MTGWARPAVLAFCCLVAPQAPARAETSAMTDAFVLATSRDFAVLHQSDVLAQVAAGARLRSFARRDNDEQTAAYEDLIAWSQAERRAAKAASETRSLDGLGPILFPFDSVVFPLNVDGPAAAQTDRALLARLRTLRGHEFDALYISAQSDALARLEHAYVDYIKNGDDPGLRRLAVSNLPKVRSLIFELRRS